eukprot:1599298-Prymnesium_polylepis.2
MPRFLTLGVLNAGPRVYMYIQFVALYINVCKSPSVVGNIAYRWVCLSRSSPSKRQINCACADTVGGELELQQKVCVSGAGEAEGGSRGSPPPACRGWFGGVGGSVHMACLRVVCYLQSAHLQTADDRRLSKQQTADGIGVRCLFLFGFVLVSRQLHLRSTVRLHASGGLVWSVCTQCVNHVCRLPSAVCPTYTRSVRLPPATCRFRGHFAAADKTADSEARGQPHPPPVPGLPHTSHRNEPMVKLGRAARQTRTHNAATK